MSPQSHHTPSPGAYPPAAPPQQHVQHAQQQPQHAQQQHAAFGHSATDFTSGDIDDLVASMGSGEGNFVCPKAYYCSSLAEDFDLDSIEPFPSHQPQQQHAAHQHGAQHPSQQQQQHQHQFHQQQAHHFAAQQQHMPPNYPQPSGAQQMMQQQVAHNGAYGSPCRTPQPQFQQVCLLLTPSCSNSIHAGSPFSPCTSHPYPPPSSSVSIRLPTSLCSRTACSVSPSSVPIHLYIHCPSSIRLQLHTPPTLSISVSHRILFHSSFNSVLLQLHLAPAPYSSNSILVRRYYDGFPSPCCSIYLYSSSNSILLQLHPASNPPYYSLHLPPSLFRCISISNAPSPFFSNLILLHLNFEYNFGHIINNDTYRL